MSHWSGAQLFFDWASSAASISSTGEYDVIVTGSDNGAVRSLTVTLTALGAGASGNAVLVDMRTGTASACAAFIDSKDRAAVIQSVDVAFPAVLGYSRQWAMPNADRFETPEVRFEQRPSHFYWLWSAVVFTALWTLHMRIRRADYALYAILGLTRRRISAMAMGELLAILLVGSICVAVVSTAGIWLRNTPPESMRVGILSMTRAVLAMSLLGIVSCWYLAGAAAAGALDAIKDR
jgi:hypothetical protein